LITFLWINVEGQRLVVLSLALVPRHVGDKDHHTKRHGGHDDHSAIFKPELVIGEASKCGTEVSSGAVRYNPETGYHPLGLVIVGEVGFGALDHVYEGAEVCGGATHAVDAVSHGCHQEVASAEDRIEQGRGAHEDVGDGDDGVANEKGGQAIETFVHKDAKDGGEEGIADAECHEDEADFAGVDMELLLQKGFQSS